MDNIRYEYMHDKENFLTVSLGSSTNASLHFHRSVEILYLMSGEMDCIVGDSSFTATADDVIFVHNYYRHAFSPAKPYKKIFIVIPYNYGNDFDSEFQHSSLPALLTDKEFNKSVLLPIFRKMLLERRKMPALVKKGYLNVILGNLFDHYPQVPFEKTHGIDFLVNVLSYIDENYKNPIDLDSLSAAFGYNKYYFSRLFNKYIGENLNNYINLVRLQHFINLSKADDSRSVAELAFECGFDSLTTFYRYFGKVYDKKPKTYLGL